MSDNAPRWPGANGSPGLDFSRTRTATDEPVSLYRDGSAFPGTSDSATPAPASATSAAADETTVNSAASATETTAKSSAPDAKPAGPAPVASDLERSKASAAEWATKPMGAPAASGASAAAPAADDRVGFVDPDVKPARALPASELGPIAGAAGGAVVAGSGANPVPPPKSGPRLPKVTPAAGSRRAATRRTRKARLRLSRIDPWSVMKTTFLFSIAFGIMLMVAMWVLWTVLEGSGAIEAVQKALGELVGEGQDAPINLPAILNGPRVLGFSAVIAAIDVVIITAVATLFAFLYNLAATVIGGLEVTLAED